MATSNEREPLLDPERHPSRDTVDAEASRDEEEEEEVPLKEERVPWTTTEIIVYSLIAIVIIVFLGIFIKGFIDAGDVKFDLKGPLWDALGGGLSGAAAMVLQVLTLMPLRTVMNYQYRFGTSMAAASRTLYEDGGFGRYYQGLGAALIQAPVSRFGDTAANNGVLALLDSNTYTKDFPVEVKTIFVSTCAALFRIVLTPVDTLKTTLQTQGKAGWKILRDRIAAYGIGTLWYGAIATAAATFAGNYPWFYTYNKLKVVLPPADGFVSTLFRQAFIGFCASVVSDTVSNSLRVIKTYRQVNRTRISYLDSARAVIAVDGLKGLFGRGLGTRILTNGLQGLMFSVLWKIFLDIWDSQNKPQ